MSDDTKVIGIEVEGLKNLIRLVVFEELEKLEQRLRDQKLVTKPVGDRLSITNLAAFLGCSVKTVSTYRNKGYLPEPKIGLNGKLYWDKEDIERALRNHDLAWKYKL